MDDKEVLKLLWNAWKTKTFFQSDDPELLDSIVRLQAWGYLSECVCVLGTEMGPEKVQYYPSDGPALTEAGEEKMNKTAIQEAADSPIGKSVGILWSGWVSIASIVLSIAALFVSIIAIGK